MRTCLNCKYRHKRSNVALCQKCIETQSYINWKSELPRTFVLLVIMTLICGVGLYGTMIFLQMAKYDDWCTGLKCGLTGTALIGGALIALSYILKFEERRNSGD